MREDLRKLIDKVKGISESPGNRRIKQLQDEWRDSTDIMLFNVGLEIPLWGEILGFDLIDYYTDPKTRLIAELKIKIFQYEVIKDDTHVDFTLPIWPGINYEPSLFGSKTELRHDRGPWIGHPLIENLQDINRLGETDLWESPAMKEIVQLCDQINELSAAEVQATPATFGRGPFGLACHLRGMQRFLVDMVDRPAFVHQILDLATTKRIQYTENREKMLGEEREKAYFGDDEVDANLISSEMYEEFIWPYEEKIARFHGGLESYHSCGNLTPFLLLISKLYGFSGSDLHISPWTDLGKAVSLLGSKVTYVKALHPIKDVLSLDEQGMKERIKEIISEASSVRIRIVADAIDKFLPSADVVEKIRTWIQVAREIQS